MIHIGKLNWEWYVWLVSGLSLHLPEDGSINWITAVCKIALKCPCKSDVLLTLQKWIGCLSTCFSVHLLTCYRFYIWGWQNKLRSCMDLSVCGFIVPFWAFKGSWTRSSNRPTCAEAEVEQVPLTLLALMKEFLVGHGGKLVGFSSWMLLNFL